MEGTQGGHDLRDICTRAAAVLLAAAILILPALASDSNTITSSFSFTSSQSISGTGFVSTYERMNANFSIFKSDRSLDSREISHGSGEYRKESSIQASDTTKQDLLAKTKTTEKIYRANFDENASMNLMSATLTFGNNRSIELFSPWGESRCLRNGRQYIAFGESFFSTSALQLDRSESLYWRKKGSAEDYKLTSSLDVNLTGRAHLIALKGEPATSTGEAASWTIEESADYSGSHHLTREASYSEKIASSTSTVEYKTEKISQGVGFISTSEKIASEPAGIEALEESEKIHGSGKYLQESSASMYEMHKSKTKKVARLDKSENLEAIYSQTELPPTGSLKAGSVKPKWSDTTRARVDNSSYQQAFSDAIVIEKESTLDLSWEKYTDDKLQEERSFFKSDLNATLVGAAHLAFTSGDDPRDEDILMDQDYEGTFDISSQIRMERTYINRTDKPDWLFCGCPAQFDVPKDGWLGCCPKGRLDWTDPDWMVQQPFNCSCPTGEKA